AVAGARGGIFAVALVRRDRAADVGRGAAAAGHGLAAVVVDGAAFAVARRGHRLRRAAGAAVADHARAVGARSAVLSAGAGGTVRSAAVDVSLALVLLVIGARAGARA